MGKKQVIEKEIVNERWKDGEISRGKDLGCISTSSIDALPVTQRARWKLFDEGK